MISQSTYLPKSHEINHDYSILGAITIAHFINDMMQAIIPTIYPQLEKAYHLSLSQIGVITLCAQLSASVFQPVVGWLTDKYPQPFSQLIAMILSSCGIIVLAYANTYHQIVIAVICIGIAASIFHPESSRVANLASGGRLNRAQAVFQLGGYGGLACAPLLVVMVILPNGQQSVLWLLFLTFFGKILLLYVGLWRRRILQSGFRKAKRNMEDIRPLNRKQLRRSIVVLLLLIFSKYFYTAGISNYFQFYAIGNFGVTEKQAQMYLFYFLLSTAIATLIGALVADHWGKIFVIRLSVLGSIPFAVMVPYVDITTAVVLITAVGFLISLSFSPILVYAQQLMPNKIGMVSGLFYGVAMGLSGIGAAVLGSLADVKGIDYIQNIISLLPFLGLVVFLFPQRTRDGFYIA